MYTVWKVLNWRNYTDKYFGILQYLSPFSMTGPKYCKN